MTRMAAEQTGQDIRIGQRDAPEERSAEQDGGLAARRLGVDATAPAPAADPLGGESLPRSVLPQGPGAPLPEDTRDRMEGAFGQSFRDVRVHDGPAADRAARAAGAEAFTHDRDIVFGRGTWQPETPAGTALLTHELAHTLSPEPEPVLRRGPGFFKSVARFFGFEVAFEEEEISVYLQSLRDAAEGGAGGSGTTGSTDGIEADFDGDNKARQVVDKGLHRSETLEVRTLLIREMMDGFLSKDDQEKILTILTDAQDFEALEISSRVGQTEMQQRFDGENRDKLLIRLAQLNDNQPHTVPPVLVDWSMAYEFNGSSEAPVDGPLGLFVRSAEIEGNDRREETLIGAPGRGLTDPSGTELRADVPHGRNEAGQITLDTVPGKVEGGEVTPVTDNPRQRTVAYPAMSTDYDGGEIKLAIPYSAYQIRVDKTGSISGDLQFLGEVVTQLEGNVNGAITGQIDVSGAARSLEQRLLKILGITKSEESSEEIEERKGRARTDSRSKEIEKGKQEFELEAEAEGKGELDVDLETKTTGRLNGKGNYSVSGPYTIDAEIAGEIKSKGEVRPGGGSILDDIYKITGPLRRRLLKRILRTRLGPLAGPASDIANDVLDGLMDGGAEWTLELNSEGDLEVTGEIQADLRGKWDAAIDVRLKSETTGKIGVSGSGSIKGSGSGTSTSTVTGEGSSDTISEEQARTKGKKSGSAVTTETGEEAARTDTELKGQANVNLPVDLDVNGTATSDVSGVSINVNIETKGTETIVRGARFGAAEPSVRLLRKPGLGADPFTRPPSETKLQRKGSQ